METYTGYIYCITNRVNGKRYIGQTITSVHKRFAEHLRCAEFYTDSTIVLYRAIRKYGKENFFVDVVEEYCACSRKDLKKILNLAEELYVFEFNTINPNGYNMTPGGYSFADHKMRSVCEVDCDGNVVNTYESIESAERVNGIRPGNIKNALRSNSHYRNGRFWYYKEDIDNVVLGKQRRLDTSPVDQYDVNGNYINSYESIKDASLATNINHGKISSVCCKSIDRYGHRRYCAGGFVWAYSGKEPELPPDVSYDKMRPVTQTALDGTPIKRFESIGSAAVELNIQRSNIGACCNGRRKTAGGYRWSFDN